MIRPSYALKLARTKFRSKRGILITSILVASLLFAALIATVIVFSGAEKSAAEFIKKAGNDKYLVSVTPNIPIEATGLSQALTIEDIREIKAFEKKFYEDLQNKYKSLGIPYDKKTEVPALTPAAWASNTLPEEQRVIKNFSSPVIKAWLEQEFEAYYKTANNKLSDLKQVGAIYGASGYFIANQQGPIAPLPGTRYIQQGKEDFSVTEPRGGVTPQEYFINAIYNGVYNFTDQQLLSRYLLLTDSSALKGIPVVVSAQEAAVLFGEKAGIGKEPEAGSEKREWLQDIQTKLKGQTYQACYRNSTEQALLEKIQRDYAEIKNNEQNKDYQKPSLIYDYPKEPCGDIVIKEDTRTAAEKQADSKAEESQKKLGLYEAPAHHLLTFQIVGIKYAHPFIDYTKGVDEYVKSLLIPQSTSLALEIPVQMYDSLPDTLKMPKVFEGQLIGVGSKEIADYRTPRVLEFKTIDEARLFLNNETCPSHESNCNKKFKASTYGSNYLILDEIGKLFTRIANIAFPTALGLAAIIIWFTISRIVAENRKETAVYRAMGAKRRDVTMIYIVYVLLIALRIIGISFIVGIGAALIINHLYGRVLTDTAATAFGIIDNAPNFNLINFESPLLLVLAGSIIVISLVASIQPLIRNAIRNPILDMRNGE